MFGRLSLVLIVLAGTAACSEPPDKERQQAEGALNAAREADAAAYAPEPLHAAEAALQKYDDAVAQRDYRLALNNALEARDRAYEAVKQAGNTKAELRSLAEHLATELEAQINSGTLRLASSAFQRAASPAADHLRASIRTATSSLQEARTLMDKHDYQHVVSRLKPVVEGLRAELAATDPSGVKKKK